MEKLKNIFTNESGTALGGEIDCKALDDKFAARTYNRFPLVISGGRGSILFDDKGKEYIDLGGGIAVNTFGVADPEWAVAVTKQLNLLQHASNLYYTKPAAELARLICEKTGLCRVFFSNSGAEANECGVKAARKYSADKYGAERHKIITLKNSFHGRTLAMIAATGQEGFHKDFLPIMPGFEYSPADDIDFIKRACSGGSVAAVMVEAVQGEGGVEPLGEGFLRELRDFTEKNDILLIADEVQCGNGRTGRLFGYMNYGITPDIVTTAKGLAGGLPLGATIFGEKTKDTLTPGSHGSTFGGNPVCAAGAVNILSRLDEKTLEGVREKSRFLVESLRGAAGVTGVSGLGLMLGVSVSGDTDKIISDCIKKGVLPIKAKNKIRLLPALNIPDTLLEKAVAALKQAIAENQKT